MSTPRKADPQPDETPTPAPRAAERPANETVEGGIYRTADGRLVNANGDEVDSKGNVKKQNG